MSSSAKPTSSMTKVGQCWYLGSNPWAGCRVEGCSPPQLAPSTERTGCAFAGPRTRALHLRAEFSEKSPLAELEQCRGRMEVNREKRISKAEGPRDCLGAEASGGAEDPSELCRRVGSLCRKSHFLHVLLCCCCCLQ